MRSTKTIPMYGLPEADSWKLISKEHATTYNTPKDYVFISYTKKELNFYLDTTNKTLDLNDSFHPLDNLAFSAQDIFLEDVIHYVSLKQIINIDRRRHRFKEVVNKILSQEILSALNKKRRAHEDDNISNRKSYIIFTGLVITIISIWYFFVQKSKKHSKSSSKKRNIQQTTSMIT